MLVEPYYTHLCLILKLGFIAFFYIQLTLQHLMDITLDIINIVICIDSRSVIQSLQTWDCRVRTDLIFKIKYIIHLLRLRNIGITLSVYAGSHHIVEFFGMIMLTA